MIQTATVKADSQDEEVVDDLLPILDIYWTSRTLKLTRSNISGPIKRPEKAKREEVSDLSGIRSHFCFFGTG